MPQVSVIIPTYNRAKYVREALDSVLAQDYKDYEIIVIDDGSTDDTRAILDGYIRSGKINYIYQENKGISAARNRGMSEAKGKYLAFLDSDDLWMPGKLSEQVKILDSGDAFLIYSYARFFYPEDGNCEIKPKFVAKNFQEMVNSPTQLPTSTVMLRRECIDKVGNFDEKLKIFEDIDLWIRIAQHYKVEFINRILAVHRRHGKNTAYDRMGIHLNSISYLENLIDKYPSFVKINELQDKIARHAYFAGREYMRKGEYPAAKTFLNKSLKFQRVSLLGNSAIYPKSLVAYLISMIKCRHWRYK